MNPSENLGRARIFGNALKSALGSEAVSDRNPVSSMKNSKLHNSEIPSSNWLEDDRLLLIQEALKMETSNETEEWIKQLRLLSLQQMEKNHSDSGFSSPCNIDSPKQVSPHMMDKAICECDDGSISSSSEQAYSQEKDFWPDGEDELRKSERLIRPVFKEQKSRPSESSGSSLKKCSASFMPTRFLKPNIGYWDKNDSHCCSSLKENFNSSNSLNFDVSGLMKLQSKWGLFDSHCHLQLVFKRQNFRGTYSGYVQKNSSSYPQCYKGCVTVFHQPWTFAQKSMWQKYLAEDNVWAAFGCHPKEASHYNDKIEKTLRAALKHSKVRALGEIGLDYSDRNTSPKAVQHDVFRRQLKIALEENLPVVVHCRDADEDAIKIMLNTVPKNTKFHLHCFTGSWNMAQRWMKMFPNVYIGITNLVTFPSAKDTREVACKLPLNRLLLETDAPYFVPKMLPQGTKHSHPGMAIFVAAQIAALKNISVQDVLWHTEKNTKSLYNLS